MELTQAKLDVAYTDDEGTRGYVDVAYANACTDEISIITQRGLAALLLSAEPRPAMV